MHFETVILVADERDAGAGALPIEARRDLEQTERIDLDELVSAIRQLGHDAVVYRSPGELSEHASLHVDDLVWSIYGGTSSRNRMALVPAICESKGLAFVGPDVYGRVICQDKEISKRIALECGLPTPSFRIVRDIREVELALDFPLPAVVKPLLEGSSIGITQQSLVRTRDALEKQLVLLLNLKMQPLIVESFVGGREVSYNVIETETGVLWNLCEVRIGGDANFFDDALFDAELKLRRDVRKSRHEISGEIATLDRQRCDQMLAMVGHIGYCRIDGKLLDGKFSFLEITPDAYIGNEGTFAAGFMARGMPYPEVVRAILATGRREPPAQ